MKTCACGATEGLSLQPSGTGLVMGSFPGSYSFGTSPYLPMVYRCKKCEKKLARRIERMLDNICK